VGFTATRYVPDGIGFETMAGQGVFSSRHPSRPALGSTHPFLQRELRPLPGMKRPEHGFDHPPLSSTKVKHEQSFTSAPPCLPSWHVRRGLYLTDYSIAVNL